MKIELTEKQKIKVYTDKALYPVMREVLLQANRTNQNKERLWVCGLGANHVLMYLELVSIGAMFQSIVEPMDIFSWALQKQVPMIILVHNHPGELLVPSEVDKNMTDPGREYRWGECRRPFNNIDEGILQFRGKGINGSAPLE